jgi:hypothetical protein
MRRSRSWWRKIIALVAMVFCAIGLSGVATAAAAPSADAATSCPHKPYNDVSRSNPFCADIAYLKDKGITHGDSHGRYHPKRAVTRQSMAGFLYRLENPKKTAPACTSKPFPDVPKSNVFCGDIKWLVDNGITQGTKKGQFLPKKAVSRESMTAFLHRLLSYGKDTSKCEYPGPYPDVDYSNVFCGDIAWAKTEGITTGYSDNRFHPKQSVSRQAMAAFLHRLKPMTVPLSTLCNSSRVNYEECEYDTDVVTVGGHTFTYVADEYGARPPDWNELFGFDANTCRSITLDFTEGDSSEKSAKASIRVIQTGVDPQKASAAQGKVDTLAARLNGSPFEIQVRSTDNGPVYVNGHASCVSESG